MLKKVYSTKINVLANFAGSIWMAAFTVIFVPLYLPYIGIEAYGLIGIFTSIQAFIILLDFGLSPTLNRELARLAATSDQVQTMHDLKRTLEIPNWLSALTIGLLLAAASPIIAAYWVQPEELTVAVITQSLLIMSFNIAVQFSSSFYVGGLLGLQKQFHLNIINIVCSTLRSAGAFVVVAFVSPTIQAFLLWQGFVAVIQLVSVSQLLRYSLPSAPEKGVFRKEILRKVWRFAVGMTGITIVSLILSQTDKVVLSRMISLKSFGYYNLAITISGQAVVTIISSITNSVYPKFSGFVSVGDEVSLLEFYHRSCQLASAFLMPTVAVIAVFSRQLLLIWTHEENTADNTHLLLSIVVVSLGLNGLMWLPYHLQLAYGWTKLNFYFNLSAIVILVPLMIAGVLKYGAVGGAASFGILNISYILISIQIMHRRILKGAQWKWYLQDILLPFVVSAAVVFAGKYFFDDNWSAVGQIVYLGFLAALSFGIIVTALPQLRRMALSYVTNVMSLRHSYN